MPLELTFKLCNIFVDDQNKALKFYTEILGFKKKEDIPLDEHRWLTVIIPSDPNAIELLLEPATTPVAKAYQQSNYLQGVPALTFFTSHLQQEVERLKKAGVHFVQPPAYLGLQGFGAIFDDTCGNLIQLIQKQ